MMFNTYFTALEATVDQTANGVGMGSFVFSLILLFVVFYFFMLRPQQKQDQEKKAMQDSLQVGDEIVTIGGIVGFILSIKENEVIIETGGDRSKIIVMKWAIKENLTQHDAQEEIGKKK